MKGFEMELVKRQIDSYRRAGKKEKGVILRNYCLLTKISRNLASKRFRKAIKESLYPRILLTLRKKNKRGRKPRYTLIHQEVIKKAWKLSGEICAERLHPVLYPYVKQLKKNGQLNNFPQEIILESCQVSCSTLKRIISRFPKTLEKKKTKGSSELYKQIPIRAYFGENANLPGYLEIDYVEHNGGNSSGTYAITGSYLCIYSGWLARTASLGKSLSSVKFIQEKNLRKIYHPIYEFHSDNDKPTLKILFEKYILGKSYCQGQIKLTRSRPYHKEDNGHVEQKNDDKVRKLVGYHRYDKEEQVEILNRLYEVEDLITNFFIPSFKLISKIKDEKGRLIRKIYDQPKTPYARLMESEKIGNEVKETLRKIYKSLNLISLRQESERLQSALYETIISRKKIMSEPVVKNYLFQGT